MNYEQTLEYLAGLGKFGINLGLTRILHLLERMGNPQHQFKSIHITGTNGKGSTTAMLCSILTHSGLKTGMYTSPHLVEYTERMIIDGVWISKEKFAQAIGQVRPFVEEMVKEGVEHPTEFEVITAAAFWFFANEKVDYAVVEVGLGGLLDSTNVIYPEVSVITNVTLEHTDRCGSTIEEIAVHKAGIIKEKTPIVTAAEEAALTVIEKTAKEKAAAVYVWGKDISGKWKEMQAGGQLAEFSIEKINLQHSFVMKLLGVHQIKNAGLAILTALLLAKQQPKITLATIEQGLGSVIWPGRFEVVSTRPITIIDGAHNPDGARVLRDSLDTFFPEKPRIFLLGILRDKDYKSILQQLVRREDYVVVTAPASERASDPQQLAGEIQATRVEVAASIEDGVKRVQEMAGKEDLICIAGSLYLIGQVRALLCDQ